MELPNAKALERKGKIWKLFQRHRIMSTDRVCDLMDASEHVDRLRVVDALIALQHEKAIMYLDNKEWKRISQ